ncbi:uncharacterized protein [Typha angustifolia]|uniref:uncharacterized protein isoform X2 n=1 Tax=Typha angustifolia TaxID=59011 RepID=UPI003C2EEE3E
MRFLRLYCQYIPLCKDEGFLSSEKKTAEMKLVLHSVENFLGSSLAGIAHFFIQMDSTNSERQEEGCRDENANAEHSGNSEGDDRHNFILSQTNSEIEKIKCNLPSILHVEQCKNCWACQQKSCPCDSEFKHAEYISFVSSSNSILPCPVELADVSYDSLRIFYRKSSSLNIASNMISLKLIMKNLRQRRRAQNITDLDHTVNESLPAVCTGNVAICPSGRLIFDSIEAAIKLRTQAKSSLIFSLGDLHCTARQISLRSHRHVNYSELIVSPSEICNTSMPKAQVELSKRKLSGFSISEEMFPSCSSATPMSSHQSTSSLHYSVSTGLLRCVWKSGLPYFEFSVEDDTGEFYVANPLRVESSVDKALDYIYLFHTGTYGRKDSRITTSNASKFVGKMKVSSSLILNSDKSNFMETEFVLFGSDDDRLSKMKSSISPAKSKWLAKKVAEMIRPGHSPKPKYIHRAEKSCSHLDVLHEVMTSECSGIDESGPADLLAEDFRPGLELTAIVVKDYHYNSKKESVVGGWGLKFLAKAEANHSDTPLQTSSAHDSSQEIYKQNRQKSARRMNVLVPAGFHGRPIARSGGPSGLTERWKSGGTCDCGGWDMGCPITVLDNKPTFSEPFTEMEPQDCGSVNLFMEGAKNGEPVLRLVNAGEGLYVIYFQSTLSPLQCFSVGVATIHSQSTDLHPNL